LPTVVISGYYGAGNTGDEAILAAMLQMLRVEMPEAAFVVLSRDPVATAAAHGVPAVGRASLARIIGLFRRADLLLSGSGGLLQDGYPRKILPVSVLYYLAICVLAVLCGCRVMFYAQGIGPLHTRLARLLVRFVANRVDLISVRDRDSAALLRRLGVKRTPVRVTADPVLGWSPGAAVEVPAWRAGKLAPGRPILGISVRPWPGDEAHLLTVAKVADRAVREWGMTPVFVPLARQVDAQVSRSVQALMVEGSRAIILPDSTPAAVYEAIAGAELLLGMRLHALIFAAMAGVPLAGLAYDPKVTSFLASVGLGGQAGPLDLDAEVLWRLLTLTREHKAEIVTALAEPMTRLRAQALTNADMAAALLHETRRRVPSPGRGGKKV